jgi:hypothetical protein
LRMAENAEHGTIGPGPLTRFRHSPERARGDQIAAT